MVNLIGHAIISVLKTKRLKWKAHQQSSVWCWDCPSRLTMLWCVTRFSREQLGQPRTSLPRQGKEYSCGTCRPVKIHLGSECTSTTCLGNLGKSGGSNLWLLKKHQSGILDGASLVSPLWEVRTVRSEGHCITLQNFSLKDYHSSMDSTLFKELRREIVIQKSRHELH